MSRCRDPDSRFANEISEVGPMDRHLTALGVHVFMGGFSIGVQEHFRLTAHLERDHEGVKYAARSWRPYRHDVPVQVDWSAQWRFQLKALYGQVDFVYSNPPCSGYSAAGSGTHAQGKNKAARLEWHRDAVRVGAEVGAKVVAIESVRQAITKGAE